MVTPEYNHSTSGVLKNALDYRYAGWNNKAPGFVSCGFAAAPGQPGHLRLVCAELLTVAIVTWLLGCLGRPDTAAGVRQSSTCLTFLGGERDGRDSRRPCERVG
jgi:NADPH-dependent FMN reductase